MAIQCLFTIGTKESTVRTVRNWSTYTPLPKSIVGVVGVEFSSVGTTLQMYWYADRSTHYNVTKATLLLLHFYPKACCGSGSSWIRINLSWDPHCVCVRILIQESKNDLQIKKKVKNFHVLKCWMFFFFRAEGLYCSSCVLYGGLGITKFQFFYQKNIQFFQL